VEDNYLIVWDVETGKALSGCTAGTDVVNQVKFFNNSDDQIVTCQNYGIRVWKIDYLNKKVKIFMTISVAKAHRCYIWKYKKANHLHGARSFRQICFFRY